MQVQSEGFDFLGMALLRRQEVAAQEEPSETAGHAATVNAAHARVELGTIIAQANPILRGWLGCFRESHRTGLSGPDVWLRRRLRAMLRKRFAVQGLFSLE